MSNPIIIIGSGFAAYQLVKALRRSDKQAPITVITADDGHDYNKPDLSHVFTNKHNADALIRQTADNFAQDNEIVIYTQTKVETIDHHAQCVTTTKGDVLSYSKLVLATGASTFIPPMNGSAVKNVITLNSRIEYQAAQNKLDQAEHVLIIGAGLIGTELAMDLSTSGKTVSVVDPCNSIMQTLLPDAISAPLQQKLIQGGVKLYLNNTVQTLEQTDFGIEITLHSGEQFLVDSVISASGLKPNIHLAQQAGLTVDKGIIVNRQLQTSDSNIYALGDCAQIENKVLSYLQPTLLSANVLAKVLLQTESQTATLKLPAMLVKVKTPNLPIQLAGHTGQSVQKWSIELDKEGITARAFDDSNNLVGFITTQNHMSNALKMLKTLPALV
ncbi:NADH:flavorubredoxin reductase NorW [Vibrio algivorus]|uniref:Nitric oxide reductase FlRd-NAD(+) reductase n=1 Tax=Vibrio algivorus TaxID=1667024 RepID=A0ABQ6ENL4_9VIBR|nr:NADH:flavorubredoxin reductase NorW [Vibrio algivorus]GLT14703.1 nitric oxide reductase FlRd-NAD(+) reductase [Vibrio algivorus]